MQILAKDALLPSKHPACPWFYVGIYTFRLGPYNEGVKKYYSRGWEQPSVPTIIKQSIHHQKKHENSSFSATILANLNHHCNLVSGFNPSENMSSSVGIMNFPTGKIIHSCSKPRVSQSVTHEIKKNIRQVLDGWETLSSSLAPH